ncbi:hypothetical protein EVAR_12615_1 [Eumeta japonica]|uniref:Nucleic-acid-binding protein from transposon X-element n=1 Tax=Eumeta variegata TaxID=151549 RepID=A0A4C1UEY6_EUMVA|nr:hypothetical protein EVAR_12615_1 [Eumeta japonica]
MSITNGDTLFMARTLAFALVMGRHNLESPSGTNRICVQMAQRLTVRLIGTRYTPMRLVLFDSYIRLTKMKEPFRYIQIVHFLRRSSNFVLMNRMQSEPHQSTSFALPKIKPIGTENSPYAVCHSQFALNVPNGLSEKYRSSYVEIEDCKNLMDRAPYLERQVYPIQAVHRMHRRDGTALGLVLVILNKMDGATDVFKSLANVCGLSGITVEPPYKRGIPGQCHRCQLYSQAAANCHAPANYHAPPRCVKCLDSPWTKELCKHPRVRRQTCLLDNKTTAWTVNTAQVKSTGSKNLHPAPLPKENQWKNLFPWVNPKTKGTENRDSHSQPPRQAGTAASATSALGDDIDTIMSIL